MSDLKHSPLFVRFPASVSMLRRALRARSGATLVEYGLLSGLVAVTSILSLSALGDVVQFQLRVADLRISPVSGPLPDVARNGDFSNNSGGVSQSWGRSVATVQDWTSNNARPFELHNPGHQGMSGVDGEPWLDMAASPGALDISQTYDDLEPGAAYLLSIDAGDRNDSLENRTEVFWNGELKGQLSPDSPDVMETFEFSVMASSDGSDDILRLVEVGGGDNEGISIGRVRLLSDN